MSLYSDARASHHEPKRGPSLLNTLLENVPGLSEALWNKPVDCVLLLGVSALAVRGGLSLHWDALSFGGHPVSY